MSSFSVAKKVTEDDIQEYFEKQKKAGKSERQIGNLLRDKILKEIENAVDNNKIPGLLSPQEVAKGMGLDKRVIEKMPELNRLVLVIVQKMAEKNYDKMSMCYFINSVVNLLGLTETDFEKFHEQNSGNDDDDDDDGDEEESETNK